MNLRLDDLVVVTSFGLPAWLAYSNGLRPRSTAVGVALVGVPAVATYLVAAWIAVREVGGLTYSVDRPKDTFGSTLKAADQAMRTAYREEPKVSADGRIPVEPYRKRLEAALAEFQSLRPPPGRWTQLVEEGLEVHRGFVEMLLSPMRLEPDDTEPLVQRAQDWTREVEKFLGEEAAQSKRIKADPPVNR